MREYKFRGKRIDNGEWTTGDLIQLLGEQGKGRKFIVDNKFGACIDNLGNFINTEAPFVNEIHPETVGQFTGLQDRNGKDIYEGDIVKYTSKERTGTRVSYKRRGYDTYAINSDIEIIGFVKFGEHDKLMTFIVDTKQVTRYESYFWGEGKRSDRPDMATNSLVKPLSTKREYEVIGSIYENPELLEATV